MEPLEQEKSEPIAIIGMGCPLPSGINNSSDFWSFLHEKKILCEYEYLKDEDSQIELIFDDERMPYLVVWVGWYKYKPIYQCAIHIDIVGDSIIIQCNYTEESIVEKLVEMGISQKNISWNFIHPQHQNYLEIAT